MKRKLSILVILAAAVFAGCIIAAVKTYRVTEIYGKVLAKGMELKRGSTVTDNDILNSQQPAIIKVTGNNRSFTLKLKGTQPVKELISNTSGRYESTIQGMRDRISQNRLKTAEYGLTTMESEKMPYDLRENEAIALCKEDSLGNLSVTFLRHGMEKPLRYNIATVTYNYLLRMDIITAKGYDYAYTSTAVYDALWKPMEQYLTDGDTIIYSVVPYLTDIDMSQICTADGRKMCEHYEMVLIDNEGN